MKQIAKKQDSFEFQALKSNPGLMPILREGELINVTLVEQSNRAVYFSVPKVGTGIIYGIELINAKGILKKLQVGDQVTAKVVVPENDEGLVELSLMEAGKQKAWQELKELKDTGEPIVAKVTGANSGGLLLEIKGVQGFLPASQLSNEHYPQSEDGDRSKITQELKNFIGQELSVKIININPRTNKLIVSEREIEAANTKDLLEKYAVGDIVPGIVSGVADFGIFIKFADQTEIEGLIHISELSHNMVDHPREVANVGDMVKAKIVEIKDGRVSLSLKALQPDPWENVGKKFKEGEKVRGEVYRLNPFGAFVKIGQDLMGLIHVSEFGSVEELKAVLEPGKNYEFMISSIKPAEKRIVLKLGTKAKSHQEKKPTDGAESL
ncbi:MAG: S1 RNA-binding domain-containing protein [Candidatus Colwellbacteria bacterium]|nr:S1 RNA-binding domain-containing protein [Candidatus Colwellbacteria bacterium]